MQERDDRELSEDDELPEAEEAEAPESEPEPSPDPEIEAEARKYGWRPREDFTKSPEGWVDAQRFLELPSTLNKKLRDERRELQAMIEAERQERERIAASMRPIAERIRQQERDRYEAELRALEERKRQAAETGDMQMYDRLMAAQTQIRPPAPLPEPQQSVDPVVSEYAKSAKWMRNEHAVAYGFNEIEKNPHVKQLPADRQLKWAEARVREVFPDEFTDTSAPPPAQPAPRAAKVDGGGLGIRRSGGADRLPADVRAVAEEFVREGLYKTVDEYAADYFQQGA